MKDITSIKKDSSNMNMIFPRSLFNKIMATIGYEAPESGGVIGIEGNVVSEYYFDVNAGVAKRFYTPSIQNIEDQVNRWYRNGKAFGGFLHSHRAGYTRLSPMDTLAAEKVMSANQLNEMFMGIICEKKLYFYKVILQDGNARSTVEQCAFEVK